MNKYAIIALSVFFFILSIVLVALPRTTYLKPFSPQATVDPLSATETFEEVTHAVYDNDPVKIPSYIANLYKQEKPKTIANVLSAADVQKRIEIDLTNQRLYAFEGPTKVFDFVISSGKWGRTPTGVFEIWIKLRSTRMEGGSRELGTYYNLPNVPYVMFFANDEIPKWRGFGIHGTYWHDNFGTPMSHGCINMRTEEVGELYYWAEPDLKGKSSIYTSDNNPGTPVIIYGDAPWG